MYKKLSLFLALILIAILVAACGIPQAEADTEEPFNNKYLSISIDKETGCEYIIYNTRSMNHTAGGITPRLDDQGEPFCSNANKNQ